MKKTLKRIWEGSNSYTMADITGLEVIIRAESYDEAKKKYNLYSGISDEYDWE